MRDLLMSRLLQFSKRHDGKGANGSKNRSHDTGRVPGEHTPCIERVNLRHTGNLKIGLAPPTRPCGRRCWVWRRRCRRASRPRVLWEGAA